MKLQQLADQLKETDLTELFVDADRFEQFSRNFNGILCSIEILEILTGPFPY